MDELSYRLDLVLPTLKDANLIRNRAFAQLVDSQGQVHNGRELDWGKVVTVRMDYQANLSRRGRVQGTALDEIGVDYRVESGRAQQAPIGPWQVG